MATALQTQLNQTFPAWTWEFDKKLAPLTYFKIGGPAEAFVRLRQEDELQQLLTFCHANHVPVTFLGGASNVIVADEGIHGVVVQLTNDDVTITPDSSQPEQQPRQMSTVTAGAGIKTALLVRRTLDAHLTGLEYFLGVPGTLSGAVYNNAHYLSHLIGEHITRVKVLNRQGRSYWLAAAECDFGYDHSRFQTSQELIFQVEFVLETGDPQVSAELLRQATVYRAQTQPLGKPSSGCIFQNVPNTPHLRELFPQFAERDHVPGGFLIDRAGLKGERQGDIVVSDKHAAFFVNEGRGSSADVATLVKRVKERVQEKFGVQLQEEVFYLGDPTTPSKAL